MLRQGRRSSKRGLADRVNLQEADSSYKCDVNVQSGEIFISLAKAFSVSLDYLARLASHSAPQVSIADLDLLEKVQIVDQPSEDDRELVKREMDLVVMKSQVRLLAGEGAVVE